MLFRSVIVSVSQMSAVVAGETRRFADLVLQQGALCFNIRYGATPDEERTRVLEGARLRAVQGAWLLEQRRVKDGEGGARAWVNKETEELLSAGHVSVFEGFYVLPVEQLPELADSPFYIQLL